MNKLLFSLIWLFVFSPVINARDSTFKAIDIGLNIKTGMNEIEAQDYDFIRALNNYDQYYGNNGLYAYSYAWSAGINVEKRVLNNKFGVYTSLRYLNMQNSLEIENSYGSSNFFYILANQDETKTDYLRVVSISEKLHFINLPIELRIYPFKPRVFNLFFGIGGEISYMLKESGNVDFLSSPMEYREKEVLDLFDDTGSFHALAYASAGILLNFNSNCYFRIAAIFPSFDLIKNPSGIVDMNTLGGGANFSLSFPF
jgi:hypothetical protein